MKKITLIFVSLFFLFLFNKTDLTGQVVFTNSTPGTYTLTIPSPALYKIECWGGGGRGGPRANNDGGAGGGGGGAYSTSTLTLPAGTYTIKVGKGGVEPGNADGDSSYLRNGTLLVLAMGGKGVNANNATGQTGGQAAAGIGTTKYSGGNGANGITVTPFYGGGGGSSAGTGSNGNNGSTSVGGAAPAGGAKGGNGKTVTDGAGSPGDTPGGAGGGARKTVSGGGQNNGGLGGPGQVIVTLACIPVSISVQASDLTVECDGSGNAAELAAWLASHGGAVAINGCGALTWTSNYTGLSDNCGATGSATVTFTVTDGAGNTATTSATFTIEDTTAPTAVCQDVTVEFDQYGTVSISADDVDNGSSDVCGSVTIAIDTADFDCDDLGDNTVTLTVTDECGNSSTCTATVTVIVPAEWTCAPGPRIESPGSKVIFCHVPPNYPAQNIQEICVAMDIETICDHLGHGDHFGLCDGTEVGYRQVVDNTRPIENDDNAISISGDQGLNVNPIAAYVQPNPFVDKASIHFSLGQPETVVLKVFNNTGQMISTLHNGKLEAGQHVFVFDGTNQSEGMYYFNLTIGSKVENVRMILNR